MGHLITPVAKTATIGLVEVPEDVAKELEDLYSYLTEHPAEVALAKFDTEDERKEFVRQAKSWGVTRDLGTLDVRVLPSKALAATELKFIIRPPLTDEEKAANARKAAERKAKADANGSKAKGK